ISIIAAMIAGRIVWGIAQVILLGLNGKPFTFAAFLAGAVTNAIPGIILQLILIPLVMLALDRAKLVKFRK
ncbi:MAG: ECF transporter S component, partial [Clostridia bacterium]|nr:ECF transporter S component [Clostridia bacterium]